MRRISIGTGKSERRTQLSRTGGTRTRETEEARAGKLRVHLTTTKNQSRTHVEVTVRNAGESDVSLEKLYLPPVDIDCAGPPRVIGNTYWMLGGLSTVLNGRKTCEPGWNFFLTSPGSEPACAMGIAEPASEDVRFLLTRTDGGVRVQPRFLLRSTPDGDPLVLRAGAQRRLTPIMFMRGHGLHETMDAYVSRLRGGAGVSLRFPPYHGLFAGYSSNAACVDKPVRLTEKRVGVLLDFLEAKGLLEYGIEYIKIEFGLCGSPVLFDPSLAERCEPGGKHLPPYDVTTYFPRGIAALVKDIHRRGLKAAIQIRPFLYARGGEEDRIVPIFRKVKAWGFDYVMCDFWFTDWDNVDAHKTAEEVARERYELLRQVVGKDVFIEGSMSPFGPLIGVVDGFRASTDYRGGTEREMAYQLASRCMFHGRIYQLDAEFYDLAEDPFTWGKVPMCSASLDRVKAYLSLCSMLGYSFLLGGNLESTSDERFELLKRTLPIAGGSAIPLDSGESDIPQIWLSRAAKGCVVPYVLAVFNWDATRCRDCCISPRRLRLNPRTSCQFFDFWEERFLGEVGSELRVRLPPFSCKVFQITEKRATPQIVANTGHISGNRGVEKLCWDKAQRTLTGTSRAPVPHASAIYIRVPRRAVPGPWRVLRSRHCAVEHVQERVLRVIPDIRDNKQRAPVRWSIAFDREKGGSAAAE